MASSLPSTPASQASAEPSTTTAAQAPRLAGASLSPQSWWVALIGLLALHLTNPYTWGLPIPGLWFPAAGVGLCLLAWLGWRAALLILLDAVLVPAQAGLLEYLWPGSRSSTGLPLIAADALLGTLELLAAWWLYHTVARGARSLGDPRSATLFLLLIPGVTLGLFALGRTTLFWLGDSPSGSFGNLLVWFWLSRLLGVVIVAPPFLTAFTPWLVRRGLAVDECVDPAPFEQSGNIGAEQITRRSWVEIAAVALVASLLSLLLASPFGRNQLAGLPLGGVPLLLIVWALRLPGGAWRQPGGVGLGGRAVAGVCRSAARRRLHASAPGQSARAVRRRPPHRFILPLDPLSGGALPPSRWPYPRCDLLSAHPRPR